MSNSPLQGSDVFQSSVIYKPLNSDLNEIRNFLSIAKSCIGPHARLKIIQSASGGHVTVTSASSRLFPVIKTTNICLKLVMQSIVTHLSAFHNCGLYCCVLSLCILENGIKSELPSYLLSEHMQFFGKLFLNLLKSDSNCHHDIKLSGLSELSNVVRAIVCSKPGCILTTDHVKKLSLLLLKAFLNSLPTSKNVCVFENISYYTEQGFDPGESKLLDGVLVKIPDSFNKHKCYQLQSVGSNKDILVVLFSVSLAGDVDFPSSRVVECGVSVWHEVLVYLKSLAKKLIFDGIQIVFCQKVIHPSLRKLLEENDILVIDRLGLQLAQDIEKISGAVPVTSLSDMQNVTYGLLTSIEVIDVGTKKYFNFQNKNLPFQTLYLCHYTEEALSEITVVCKQVIKTLYRLLKQPAVCSGAGCTEVHVAHLVKKEVLRHLPDLVQQFNCSTVMVLKSLEVFLTSLHDLALALNHGSRLDFVTEHVYDHLWKMRHDNNFPSDNDTCQCGQFTAHSVGLHQWSFLERTVDISSQDEHCMPPADLENRPTIMDELNSKASAAAIAFETASSLLKIGLCIVSRT